MFRRAMIIGTALSTGLSLAVLPALPAAGQDSPWRVVASGLDSPRGLAFAPNGTLYVAEAGVGGAGPCVPHPLGQICYGATGAVTEVKRGDQTRVLTGLPSFELQGTPEVFGPSDVALNGSGNLFVTLGLGADPAVRAALPAEGQTAATLVRAKPAQGTFRLVADLGGFELSDNPDGGLPDSNPQGLLTTAAGQVVADAGGNSLLRVSAAGRISTLAVFPPRLVPNPFGGPDIPMQAVPTTVTRGPDGELYVGQLTGFPFPVGGANIFRVEPGEPPEVVAGGFTNIIDIAFGPDGSLYVLEIAHNGLLSGDPTGALIRVDQNGSRTLIAGEGLTMPTGLAIRDGEAYVSNCGVCADTGEVIAIPLPGQTS
ncbi:ScyD/ScyE family protein [Kribbella sp. NPDC050470]|uniref:ScyD/ScyE family protein n=1 Tax=unclassified Kribbella TaxID=2644121 RepID=UPI0037AF6F70